MLMAPMHRGGAEQAAVQCRSYSAGHAGLPKNSEPGRGNRPMSSRQYWQEVSLLEQRTKRTCQAQRTAIHVIGHLGRFSRGKHTIECALH